jgi:hypothetical protein
MYKFFYFKIEIKTKIDSYMPCAAMAHPTKYVEEQELQEVAEFNFKLA